MKKILCLSCLAIALQAHSQVSIDPSATIGATGSVQFAYKGTQVTLTTVRAADNHIWLQQNLGATQVATAQNDVASYGDYFQFGRWDDGHQSPVSTVAPASGLAANNPGGLGAGTSTYYNGFWSGGNGGDTWSGTAATATNGKDPCTALGTGWRLPTAAEWTAVKTAEGMDGNWDAAVIPPAYLNSNLKLSRAGYRTGSGSFNYLGGAVMMWTASVQAGGQPEVLVSGVGLNYVGNPGITRDVGASCRCIKTTSTPPVGCTGTPTAPVMSTTASSLCSGNTIALAATQSSTANGITYQWEQSTTGTAGSWSNVSGGSGATTLTYTSAALTANTYFRVVATCTSSALTAASSTVLITVNPQLTPSLTISANTNGPICSGNPVTFTASPNNGGSAPLYQWKKGSVNVGNGSATYTDNTLTATDVISCEMISNAPCAAATPVASNTLSLTVNDVVTPVAVISATPANGVCAGASVTFDAVQLNGGTAPVYEWFQNGNPVGSNAASYSYIPVDGDVITVVLTSNAVCTSTATDTADPVIASVFALPAQPTITVANNVLSSSATSDNQWYKNGTAIPGADQQTYTVVDAGYYQVRVTNAHDCSSLSDSLLADPAVGIGQYETGFSISTYPAPFKSGFRISVANKAQVSQSYKLAVVNQLGQTVYRDQFEGNTYHVSVPELPGGLYLVIISNETGKATLKVVKE